MPDEYIDLREASRLSGYSVDYLRKLMRDGVLPGRKFRLTWKVQREALINYARESGKEVAAQR